MGFVKTLSASAAICLLGSAASAVTVNYFTTALDFENQGTVFVETFNDGSVDTPFAVTTDVGRVRNNRWRDRLTSSASTTFSFSSPVTGFGGIWNLAGPGGQGLGISAILSLAGGGTFVIPQEFLNSLAGDFFGFTTDTEFDAITLNAGSQGGIAETFDLDDLSVVTAPTPVPTPYSGALLLTAVAGGAVVARRKRKAG